jgi:hypothetical protein
MGNYWIVVNQMTSGSPSSYVLMPDEVRELAHRNERDGRASYWLETGVYENATFREAWDRIGRGDSQ